MVATASKRRRGNRLQNDLFTGLQAEISIDTESKTLRVHDGVKAGGYEAGMPTIYGIAELNALAPASDSRVYLAYHTTPGDGGHGVFRGVTGAALGYYTAGTGTKPANNGTIFANATGTSAWIREYTGLVDILWFGAVGDGVFDNTASITQALSIGDSILVPTGNFKINSLITFSTLGQELVGLGDQSVITQGVATAYINIRASSVSIRDIKLIGTIASAGITIGNSASDITLDSITFYQGQQRVLLYTCSRIAINNCTFNNTGFGVIQQLGNVSSDVSISNCTAIQMINDFIEANCASTAPSKNWRIENNQYLGNAAYPVGILEGRFVGITSVENVIITGNIVEKSNGDAAIHLEDTLGDTIISNNIFDNIVVSAGNTGYIYVLNASENTVVTGNMFKRTDTTLPLAYAYSCGSGYYGDEVIFTNNKIIGNGTVKNLAGLDVTFNGGLGMLIATNYFFKLSRALNFSSGSEIKFDGNLCFACDYGVALAATATSGGGNHYIITNNHFIGTLLEDIGTSTNSNGTHPPTNWVIMNNTISKMLRFMDALGTGANICSGVITNNYFVATATYNVSRAGIQVQFANNMFEADVVKSPHTILLNFANDAAAAAAGVSLNGMYRNGSIVQVRVV